MVNLNLVYMHSRLGVSSVSKKWRKFGTKEMNRLFSFVLRLSCLFDIGLTRNMISPCKDEQACDGK